MKPLISLLLTAMLLALSGCDADRDPVTADSLALKPAQLDWVGQKIFANECASRFDCLVHWNEGEAFPSLGIGHFIWYPEGVEGRFTESFPQLIRYMVQRQAKVPDWLRNLEPFDAPWPDRAAFLALEDSSRVAELREFLAGTQGLQAEFIFRRAAESLGKIVAAAPENRQQQVSARLEALSATPGGVYALMDYVNFKGEGLAEGERYQGQGWGLLQVLLEMDAAGDKTELQSFREAAGRVLTRRAENAENPIERERWLPGWLKRLETYREPAGGPES
ncbi:MAG TPA: hypothetical protein DD385_05970 [Marinobacter sp.]|jgi:hypothetical protein|nr:hypothetical protein AQ621_07000 [Marinobacter sp. P4B1]HBM49677.1 hypothetical protein [Marinobacter sp.]|tara:strand:+ start:2983 stop:3816 length:834 start_codon:yes stop_codon:yes gene_type:complete